MGSDVAASLWLQLKAWLQLLMMSVNVFLDVEVVLQSFDREDLQYYEKTFFYKSNYHSFSYLCCWLDSYFQNYLLLQMILRRCAESVPTELNSNVARILRAPYLTAAASEITGDAEAAKANANHLAQIAPLAPNDPQVVARAMQFQATVVALRQTTNVMEVVVGEEAQWLATIG